MRTPLQPKVGSRWRGFHFALLVLLMMTIRGVSVSEGPVNTPLKPFLFHRFGVSNVTSATWKYVGQVGARWWRTPPVLWESVEPTRGQYQFDRLDATLRLTHDAGIIPVVPLVCDSSWGAPRRADESDSEQPGEGEESPARVAISRSRFPTDVNAWQSFVTQLVERYDGDGQEDMPGLKLSVRYWQLGREIPEGWSDTPFRLIDFLQITSEALRKADPEAVILLPGFGSRALSMLAYMDDYLKPEQNPVGVGVPREGLRKSTEYQDLRRLFEVVFENGRDYYDVCDLHLYGQPELIPEKVRWVKDGMGRFDYSKPLVCMEAGGPVSDLGDEYSDAANAEQIAKALCFGMEAGIQSMAFPLSPNYTSLRPAYQRLCLLDASDSPKPSFHNYRLIVRLLQDFDSVQQIKVGRRNVGFAFSRSGLQTYAIWTEEPHPVKLPSRPNRLRESTLITEPGQSEPATRLIPAGTPVRANLTTTPLLFEELPPKAQMQ
ncbi:MAG: hypothetical protein HY318_14340 [Armatimonadetes bacterium]|nr:hypothetical protein [Armatimonadota bacterium]